MADHTGFILAAYAVTGVVLAGMVGLILFDYRVQRRLLDDLSNRLGRREGVGDRISERGGDDEP